MTARKTPATARQIDRLLHDAATMPDVPAGDHLTDEEFVAYSMDPRDVSGPAIARIDAHLESCDECAAQMEHLLAVSEAWRGPAGATRLTDLAEQLRRSFVTSTAGTVRLTSLLQALRPAAAFVAAAAGSLDAASQDKVDHVSIADDEDGNLRIGVSSFDVALEGTRVMIDPFNASLTLQRIGADQVGGEVLIRHSDRAGLPPDAVVTLRVDPAAVP
jgi:anti-sigma factor RsiW